VAHPVFNFVAQTGRRSDSAHAYIHATRAVHSNLYLACNTKVDKVIIENGRAVAVQTVYVPAALPFASILVADNVYSPTKPIGDVRPFRIPVFRHN
jgi:choline dehydrogenase-like flavoprotein